MNNSYKISIVLPTYNRANMLKDCIENILNQTYKNIEIIIVNDCSSDHTESVLESYRQHEKIITLKLPTNLGTPAALNTGFALATGDYLTWTSDDNLLHPNFCDTFVKTFVEDPSVDYLYCNYTFFKDRIRSNDKVCYPLYNTQLEFLINFYGSAGFMWTKKVRSVVGDFDTDLFGVEDWDYLLRIIFNNFKFKKINKALYHYRAHAGSLTAQLIKTPKYNELHAKVLEKFYRDFRQYFIDTPNLIPKISEGHRKDVKDFFLERLKTMSIIER